MSGTKRIFTYVLIIIAVIIVLITIGLFIVRAFHLDSKLLKGQIESILTSKLNRAVIIEGDVNIRYALAPTVTFNNAIMVNPDGWGHDPFVSINRAVVQIELFPILYLKIKIPYVHIYGADINLESKGDGIDNWDFDLDDGDKDEDEKNYTADRILKSLSINNVIAEDITFKYIDGNREKTHLVKGKILKGSARQDQPVVAELTGIYLEKPLSIRATSFTLFELIKSIKKFPINATGKYLEADFDISGILSFPDDFEGTDLSVNIQGTKFTELEDLLDINLPEFKNYSVNSDVLITGKSFELDDLDLTYNDTNSKGDIKADFSDEKPNITGHLDILNLDLSPFLDISQNSPDKENDTDVNNNGHDLSPYFDYLNKIDANLELSTDQIINLPVSLDNISIKPQIVNGTLNNPFEIKIEGIEMEGQLDIDALNDLPIVQLEVHSKDPDLVALTDETRGKRINLDIESGDLKLWARGRDIGSLLDSAKVYLEIKKVRLYRRQYTERYTKDPINIQVAKLDIETGDQLVASVHGSLLDHPTSINMITCKPSSLYAGNKCPVKMTMNTSVSRIRVNGDITKHEEHLDSNFDIEWLINNLADFRDSVPGLSDANMPLRVSASLSDTQNMFSLRDIDLKIGRSHIEGEFIRELKGNDTEDTLTLNADLIDATQLGKISVSKNPNESEKDIDTGIDFDIPIVPANLPGIDSYIEINIKKILLGKSEFTNLVLSSHIKKGIMEESEFSAQTGDTKFNGDVSIDVTGAIPKAQLHLYASDVNVGDILESFGINEDIGFESKELILKIDFAGRTIKEVFKNSSFNAEIEHGVWTVMKRENKENIVIDIKNGLLSTKPNVPISIDMEGSYKDTPLSIDLKVKNLLSGHASTGVKSPVTLNAEFSGTNINIDGLISYPLSQRNSDLNISINGENLQSLNDALESNLPQIGPYELTGELTTTSTSVNFNNIELSVGENLITGNIDLANLDHIPNLDVELYSDEIEIRDFIKSTEEEKIKENEESFIEKLNPISKPDEEIEVDTGLVFGPIIDSLKLRLMNANINMRINSLLVNGVSIGDFGLSGTLYNGRLIVNHLRLNTPGGQINSAINAQIIHNTIKLDIVSIIRDFQYSYLMDTNEDYEDHEGTMDLRIDLDTYGENINEFDDNLNGYAKFLVSPQSIGTKAIDMWATNILFSFMPGILGKSESKMNCIVGRFNLSNGLMKPKKVFIDTTNVRIRATGYIDLGNDRLNLVFKPLPKRPQLFSLGVPITVTGTIENYRIATNVFHVGWYTVRLYYYAFDYVRQWVFKESIPSDGSDICVKMDFETSPSQ